MLLSVKREILYRVKFAWPLVLKMSNTYGYLKIVLMATNKTYTKNIQK